ncbi:MAG: hypothetical protein K6B41_00855 [Butyrivibrio sp.]|nr:hypothetical protein [Butyrivibrio sp.]
MNKKILIGIDFILVFAAYVGFMTFSFGGDTLSHIMNPLVNIEAWRTYGRYLAFALGEAMLHFGVSATDIYKPSWLILVVLIAITIFLFQLTFEELFEKELESKTFKILFICITLIALINGLVCEFFMFPEAFINFGLAFLLSGIATFSFAKNKKVIALVAAICASMFYQTSLITIAIILVAYMYIENDCVIELDLFKKEFLVVMIIGLIGVINIISSKVLYMMGIVVDETRSASVSDFGNKLYLIAHDFWKILQSGKGLMPGIYIPLIMMILPLVFVVIYGVTNQDMLSIADYIIVQIVEIVLVLSLSIVQNNNSGLIPRLVFNFYTMQMCMILIAVKICISEEVVVKVFTVAAFGYVLIQLLSCEMISQNRRVSNILDITYAQEVMQEIHKYEEESGIKVKYIVSYVDTNYANSYENVYYKTDQINERTLGLTSYSLLEYVNGEATEFEKGEYDNAVYEEYFEGKNWDEFNPDEQLVFIGDTLHWIAF